MKPVSTAFPFVGVVTLLLASSLGFCQAPAYSPVVIAGRSHDYNLALNGYDFGSGVCTGRGDCPNFRIGNATRLRGPLPRQRTR